MRANAPMKCLSCDLLSRFRSGSEFWVNTHILELKSSQLTATNCSFLSHEGTAGNDRGGAEIVKSFLDLCTLFFCHAPAISSAPSRLTFLWMSISISECLFDRNGSVLALGGCGVGKIRASSLVRSRFGTFYITHGGTQYTVLDVDVASMRSITAHSKLWRDEDRPGQMLVSRRMGISSNIDSGVLGAVSSAHFRS